MTPVWSLSSSADPTRGTPQPGLDISGPQVGLGAQRARQLTDLSPPPEQSDAVIQVRGSDVVDVSSLMP